MYRKLLIEINTLCLACSPLESVEECSNCNSKWILPFGVWRMIKGPFPIEERQWPQDNLIEKITVHGPWMNSAYSPRVLHWKPESDIGFCLNDSFSRTHDMDDLEKLIGQWTCCLRKVCD